MALSQRFVQNIMQLCKSEAISRLCKEYSAIPPPTAAKESFEITLFSLILLRKISENSVISKYYLVALAAVKSLNFQRSFYFFR
jgi:hypothetical protein